MVNMGKYSPKKGNVRENNECLTALINFADLALFRQIFKALIIFADNAVFRQIFSHIKPQADKINHF